MDETQIKLVIEAALLAAGRPLSLDTLASLFGTKASELDKEMLARALDALGEDYRERGLELKEVASGYRIQIRSSMSDWLTPLWEERAPRYTRALLETLALIAYRQPITRAEIEEVRGVAVSSNIVRTLMERNWIRVVGHRDVPGKPAMFGTTKDFLDYFGLKKLEDLPALADIKDGLPELYPQADFIEAIAVDTGEADEAGTSATQSEAASSDGVVSEADSFGTEGSEAETFEAADDGHRVEEAEEVLAADAGSASDSESGASSESEAERLSEAVSEKLQDDPLAQTGEPEDDRDVVSEDDADDQEAVSEDDQKAVSEDDQDAVSEDDQDAVSEDDRDAVSEDDRDAVSEDDRDAASDDDSNTVSDTPLSRVETG